MTSPTTFQFDTSGAVWVGLTERQNFTPMNWPDLSPFVQGYGQAMAQALYERLVAEGMDPAAAQEAVAFRNWAPKTLARIMEDCGRFLALHEKAPDGGRFWRARQKGLFAHEAFPPQTPYVGDDGKVYLREGGQ